ncbi:hypothetical protein LPJ53_004846 [Coemansia erecta]|uniref:Formamidopyrimidine-DNA glycosylase catalytic domain-containing protein n=1 Tax=Coemansia erecta TaxID=147472 RepID=A0A9W7XY50_9FUNG|nr:hypothetical protein LPJ53_004846 [Coemansia erecta]
MPELPEVERARQTLHRHCINKEISWVRAADDPLVFPEKRGYALAHMLKGRRVLDTGRRGKLFWLALSDNLLLLLHFGMTGDIHVSGEPQTRYRKDTTDEDADSGAWPPLYTKLEIEFGRSLAIAFSDPRRLGRIRVFAGTPQECPLVKKLGFDPIIDPPQPEQFCASLRARRSPVKALLLRQDFSAGVGNWIADEVLYQSKIHPAQPACTLSDAQAHVLLEQIRNVCTTAVDVNAESERFPASWLFHHRWAKAGRKSLVPAMPGGQHIEFVTVAGRTSAIVPDVQVLEPSDVVPSDTEVEDDDEERMPPPPPATLRKPTVRRKFRLKRDTAE